MKHNNDTNTRLNVQIPFNLYEALKLCAKEDDLNISQLVRRSLRGIPRIEKKFQSLSATAPTLPLQVLKTLAPELPTDDSEDVMIPAPSFPSRLAKPARVAPASPAPAPCVHPVTPVPIPVPADPFDPDYCRAVYEAHLAKNPSGTKPV